MKTEPTWKACYLIALACIIAVTGLSCRKQEPKSKATVGEQILVYLGYKSGSSRIVKLCGQDMKGRGGLPSGVFLDEGTGFAAGFGPNEEIRVLGKAGEKAMLICKEGATVEYADGLVLIMKNAHWIDKATGNDHGFGELEDIPLR
jgi:hypothetical protein